MNMLSARRVLLIGALVLSCAFAGCATTLLYNHADWLIVRQLDGYFDLSRAQKAFLSARLDGILLHHRYEALPRYEAVVRQVSDKVRRGLTKDDLDWAFLEYDQLKADLFARFAADGADFVQSVKEPQISRLKMVLQQRMVKEEGLLRDSVEARLQKRTERIVSLAREWLGPMTRGQESEITRLAMTFPDTVPAWYTHHLKRNEQLIAVIESRTSADTAARLREWLVEQDKYADSLFLETSKQFRQHVAELVLALDRLATAEQRRHFLAKLDELAQTIQGLSRA